jgi:hypothetical protein
MRRCCCCCCWLLHSRQRVFHFLAKGQYLLYDEKIIVCSFHHHVHNRPGFSDNRWGWIYVGILVTMIGVPPGKYHQFLLLFRIHAGWINRDDDQRLVTAAAAEWVRSEDTDHLLLL